MKTNSSMFSVSGKVALVTGGRRGLGLAMALGLAEAGCRVAVAAASREHEELARAFRKAGAELFYIKTDLCNRAQQMRLIPKVIKHFGRLDILVNNAGSQHRQPALDFDLNQWDRMIQLMLTSVFLISRQAARVMEKQGGGKIINIASLASFQGGWTIPAYAAAKHGVAGLTKALANEWAAKNINVNAIAPGYFATDMCEALRHDPVREPKIRERIPAGRWGQPEDLVGALLFLASNAGNYVHGHVLVVDGGWMGR
jgi:2-deoxy-D-gluconate 3-dehydrogenase